MNAWTVPQMSEQMSCESRARAEMCLCVTLYTLCDVDDVAHGMACMHDADGQRRTTVYVFESW